MILKHCDFLKVNYFIQLVSFKTVSYQRKTEAILLGVAGPLEEFFRTLNA